MDNNFYGGSENKGFLENSELSQFYAQHEIKFNAHTGHDAFCTLLNFLHEYGQTPIFINCKRQATLEPDPKISSAETTLQNHTLLFATAAVQTLPDKDEFYTGRVGIAALSINIGLGMGIEFLKRYDNDLCMASLAVVRNMPAVISPNFYANPKELIKDFHIHLHSSMDFLKSRLGKDRSLEAMLLKTLIDSEQGVKLDTIFKSSGTSINNCNVKKYTEDDYKNATSEYQRILSEHNKENQGLAARVADYDNAISEIKLLNKLVDAYFSGKDVAIQTAKGKLDKFRLEHHHK